MHYRSVDLCFSDPEGQTTQTCPRRLRGRQARRWGGGGDGQWSAESVTKSGRSSAWHHCFVSEELARSQPAAERGVCAVPTTWTVFFMNRMHWSPYSQFYISRSHCVCVYIKHLSLSGSVVSSPRGDDVTTETTQRCRCQTHFRWWDTKHTSTSFEFIYSIAVVLILCNSKAPKNF